MHSYNLKLALSGNTNFKEQGKLRLRLFCVNSVHYSGERDAVIISWSTIPLDERPKLSNI